LAKSVANVGKLKTKQKATAMMKLFLMMFDKSVGPIEQDPAAIHSCTDEIKAIW